MRPAFVYELIDPRTRRRVYIGCTTNPELRLRQHLAGECKTTRAWVLAIKVLGVAPVMRIRRTRPELQAFKLERSWIRAARARCEPILNRN